MINKTTYKNYKKYLNIEKTLRENERAGFVFIYPKTHKKIAYSLILIGFATYPLPTGSIFFIGIGFRILNKRYIDLKFSLEKKLNKLSYG